MAFYDKSKQKVKIMSNQKDASGLTKQERHDIIINYVKDIDKPTKVFHLQWTPGDLLNSKTLGSTPMFWYKKYKWSRSQIEEMFFRARIEIDDAFDMSLQQVFGGTAGPRWRGDVDIPKQKKQRAEEKAQNIGTKNKEIWNAVSDFGADKSINYKTFSDNLKHRGINVSPMLANQLFDQLGGPKGKINKQEIDAIVRQLDRVKLPTDFASISWDDMSGKLGAQLVMKRVLLAVSAGEPFDVDDFVFASKIGVKLWRLLSDRECLFDLRALQIKYIQDDRTNWNNLGIYLKGAIDEYGNNNFGSESRKFGESFCNLYLREEAKGLKLYHKIEKCKLNWTDFPAESLHFVRRLGNPTHHAVEYNVSANQGYLSQSDQWTMLRHLLLINMYLIQ